jgi:Ca-activated chloride channel family protein
MRLRNLLLALLLALPAVDAAAQGIIVPGPCRDCRRPWVPPAGRIQPLPIESVTLDTKIVGQVATTHVTQVFRNPHDAILEGTYFFPIPSDASITEFAIWDGDRRFVGEVRSREEARRIYDAIVRQVRDPGLLEYAGENLFQASIFPINPRSTKKLEIIYTQVLRAEAGTVAYRYPLGVGRNAAVVERVAGRVAIESGRGLRTVYSPSHDVDVARRGDRSATVSFEARGQEGRRDLQLFYSLSDAEVGASLLTYREPGKDGYFLLLLAPRSETVQREYAAKDVVFVLDVSGSMRDEGKIDKAKRALTFGIRGLNAADRFNVIAFSGETRLMEEGLMRADAAGIRRGVSFVDGIRATGGTNINEALTTAFAQFPRESTRPKLLVFLTDGLPTVGETDPDRILANVRAARRDGMRLFSFGVGYDVNTRLLDRVAAENGGTADYVEPQEDLERKVSAFFDKVNHPVLTDLRLEMGAARTDLVYPRVLPDLFRGGQVALVGRYRNETELRDITLRLTGTAGTVRQTFTYPNQTFPRRAEENDFLPRLWATRRVGWLMEQIRSNGESRELREEVVDLGTRYGIVTPYTSYLALEPGAEANAAVMRRTRPMPTVQDASANGRGAVAGSPPPPPPPMSAPASPEGFLMADSALAVTGMAGVRQSRVSRERQEAVRTEADAGTGMRSVGTKTFYLRDGVWTDAEIREPTTLPVTRVAFGSDAYFALVGRTPELARYFALGEQVAVVHGGRIYRTTSPEGGGHAH